MKLFEKLTERLTLDQITLVHNIELLKKMRITKKFNKIYDQLQSWIYYCQGSFDSIESIKLGRIIYSNVSRNEYYDCGFNRIKKDIADVMTHYSMIFLFPMLHLSKYNNLDILSKFAPSMIPPTEH